MAGFRNLRTLADAHDKGQYLYRSFRKSPTQTTASGIWFDLSMSPGNPVPNYFIGPSGVFTSLKRSTDGGIDHGQNVNGLGYKKHLRKLMVYSTSGTAVPLNMILMDYVGFYPFLDESVTDEQFVDNTNPLPRYSSGEGLNLMAVVVASQTGGQTITVKYTNQDGVTGRTTPAVLMTTQAVNGTILTSASAGNNTTGCFIPLQGTDSGVRAVESVTVGGSGDVGLFALVLVKPLANLDLVGIDAPTEIDYWMDKAGSIPEILDDAYLNFVCLPVGTLAGASFHGIIETSWN
jgi:hypothetical protein